MSHAPLSRRSILAGFAVSAPVLALPAVAAAAIRPDPVISIAEHAPAEPTLIDKLQPERRALRRKYNAAHRLYKKLSDELARRMPKPDPSIAYGEEANDGDFLEYRMKEYRSDFHTMHGYIESFIIERRLAEIVPQPAKRIDKEEGGFILDVLDEGTFPLTEKQIARRERLEARLELSRRYEEQIGRLRHQIGLTAAERECDRLCERLSRIEERILATPAVTRSDFAVKLTINQYHGDNFAADDIIRDIRRMVAAPQDFVRGFVAREAVRS